MSVAEKALEADIRAMAAIAEQISRCKHERAEVVDGGARWCIDCGAYFPKRGPVNVRHCSMQTMAMVFDPEDLSGVMPGWGCCKCRIYNGKQRTECRGCGHTRCDA